MTITRTSKPNLSHYKPQPPKQKPSPFLSQKSKKKMFPLGLTDGAHVRNLPEGLLLVKNYKFALRKRLEQM